MKIIYIIMLSFILISCNNKYQIVDENKFGKNLNGELVTLNTLKNNNGCIAQFTNYGARWVSMLVPDKNGKFEDVILGFSTIDGYVNAREPYHGAITGRVCGRINQGIMKLEDNIIKLANNDLFGLPNRNHLHGGVEGFHKKIWKLIGTSESKDGQSIEYSYLSKDGEEGYPGNLDVRVRYTLTNDNILRIEYFAYTDKLTVVNLTNHVFFNLSSNHSESVNNHLLLINSSSYVACDKELIPTGDIISVKDTPMDFQKLTKIGSRINEDYPDIIKDKGYATAYVLNNNSEELTFAAKLKDSKSGRELLIYTNQPSLQLYNAWLMDGSDIGKQSRKYGEAAGVALETQGMPDAPNNPSFKSITITPDQPYYHVVEHRFCTNR